MRYKAVLCTLATLFIAVSCTPPTARLYELPILNGTSVITFHEYKNKQQLQRVIGQKSGQAVWSPNDNKCDVYFVAGDFTTLGHEVYHCYKGAFHEE